MSFISDFRTIIEGDPSINAICNGGIKFSHLAEDFDIGKTYIAWDYKVLEQNNVLNFNDAYTTYTIYITATANDTVVLDNLVDLVVNYLNTKTTTNFPDIYFVNDQKTTTLQKPKNVYQNSLEFGCIYIG